MNPIVELPLQDWRQQCPVALQQQALQALEDGSVLLFPQLGFSMDDAEAQLLSPAVAARSKNVSFNVTTGKLSGTSLDAPAAARLEAMVRRFAECSNALLQGLLPQYKAGLVQGRTSFRPVAVEGRSTSWRKDDTRLHVDSFPSSPVQGRRILRVFCNIAPHGRNRTWRLGEPFERVARHCLPSLSGPLWGSSWLLRLGMVTKSRRSAYDHFMLQIHDRMKADSDYQAAAIQLTRDFPPGCTWMAFTDQVSHAAIAGQHMLEQTFYLPVASMQEPSKSPLRVLERLMNRQLA